MAFVVEDGTGLPTANAYVSVEEADAILATNIHSSWTALEVGMKELLIMWATRILNERARWRGTRVSATSALPFPRSNLRDADNVFYPDDEIPQPLKVAVSVLADHLSVGDPTLPRSDKNIKRLDVDVISIQFDVDTTPERWPTSLGLILKDIANISFGSTGGKRIIKH